jgi:ABC-type transport system substrate-binding protein
MDVLASPHILAEGDESCTDFAASLGTTMICFRTDHAPFADIRLRQAVAAVLAPVGGAYADVGLVSRPATGGGLLPPAMPGHDHHVGVARDADAARALLADAGHPGGAGLAPLEMVITSGLELLREPIREALADVGLGVEFSISARAARIAAEPCDVWVTTWLADYPDPDGFFRGLLTDPCDPLVDEEMTRELVDLMNQARASRDQDERLALYGRVDRLLVAEWVAVVPLAYSRTALLRRPWVHGLWANALTPFRLDGVMVDRESAQPPDAAG